ncbi:hypothetical protein Q9966_003100 [Columba livia]|nr:hypothetical protein Q9966_003100 [Columba livia]
MLAPWRGRNVAQSSRPAKSTCATASAGVAACTLVTPLPMPLQDLNCALERPEEEHHLASEAFLIVMTAAVELWGDAIGGATSRSKEAALKLLQEEPRRSDINMAKLAL